MSRVLVTGASGFIGQALVRQLLEAGYEVSVLLRNPNSLDGLPWAGRVRIVSGDLAWPESLQGSCQDQDAVLHAAGFAHNTRGSELLHEAVNHRGARHMLAEARQSGVKRFIYLGSSKAGEADSAYARAKRAGEEAVLAAHEPGKLLTCCLHPVAVYGPGMKGNLASWMRLLRKGLAPPVPPVDTRVALIGREDLCRAILCVLRSAPDQGLWGRSWLLSDGEAHGVKGIENLLRQQLGKPPAKWHVPRAVFLAAAVTGDLLSSLRIPLLSFGRNGYNTLFCEAFIPGEEFRQASGFRPAQRFEDELPAILAAMNHN